MVIDLKVAVPEPETGRSLKLVSPAAPAGKERSSRVTADPVGAMPPAQLAGLLHLLSLPAPLHWKLAGASRSSRFSISRPRARGREVRLVGWFSKRRRKRDQSKRFIDGGLFRESGTEFNSVPTVFCAKCPSLVPRTRTSPFRPGKTSELDAGAVFPSSISRSSSPPLHPDRGVRCGGESVRLCAR